MRASVGFILRTGLLLHLVLIGIPFRFGLVPVGLGQFLPSVTLVPLLEAAIPPPCSLFDAERECAATEEVAIRDFGVRFCSAYGLAWAAFFVSLRKRRNNGTVVSAVAFHKILLVLSSAFLFTVVWLQTFFHPTPVEQEFRSDFYNSMVVCYLAAIAISLWTVLRAKPKSGGDAQQANREESMKWSIPANAIFCGAVFNIFVATASFQAHINRRPYANGYGNEVLLSSVVQVCSIMGTVQTAVHSLLLFRIRYFLTMPQLRSLCLYRVTVHALAIALNRLFLHFPATDLELTSTLRQMDPRLRMAIRVSSILTYLFGYLCAGKAEGTGRILAGGKED